MGESIEDLFVVLTGDPAQLLAAFTEVTAAGEEMAAAVTASMTEVRAAMAEGTAGAGVGAGAAGAEAVVAENEQLLASMESVGAASAQMAAEVEANYGAMASRTAELSQGMVAAEREAAAANAEVGAAMAGTAAQAEAGAAKAATAADGLGKAGGLMSQAMFGAKLGLAAAAVESVKMAGDFQSASERLALSAGEDQNAVSKVSQGMLSMAGQVGYSADQLATAMYKVESGGFHAAQGGLDVLRAAAEGAKTENADLTTVADALTSALTDYHLKASDAATVTSKLVAATASGKMTFQELASSMSAVLPVASANHISLNDILGDLASMTMHGMTAQQATQNLADAIRHMTDNNGPAQKELAALGINATQLAQSLGSKGLSGTINEISDAITKRMGPDGMVVLNLTDAFKGLAPPVQNLASKVLDGSMSLKDFTAAAKGLDVINAKQAQSFATLAGTMHGIGTEAKSGSEVYQAYSGAMKKAMGDATGMNVALMISGENAGNTAKAISAVSAATAEAGNHVKGWSEIQQTFNQKWAEFKDGLGAAAIQIGSALLPPLGVLLSVLGSLFKLLADHPVLLVGLATAITVALIPAIVAATAATWAWTVALLANPLTWVVMLVAALAMGVYELIKHWQGVADFFKGIWHAITSVFDGIKKAWDDFIGGFSNPLAKIGPGVSAFERFFLGMGANVKKSIDAVTHFITGGPAEWGRVLGEAAGFLTRKAWDAAQGLYHGFIDGAKALNDWILNFPHMVTSGLATAGTWLLHTGSDLIHGLVTGVKNAAEDLWAWLKTVPGAILDFFKNLPSMLYNAGADIIHGLWNGFTSFIGNVISGIGDFVKNFIAGFLHGFGIASPSTVMHNIGIDIIVGLWNGFSSWIGTMFSNISGFINGIIGQWANSATWLVSAGYNLLVGIWNGIASGWSWLMGKVSSLATGIKNAALSALGIGSPSKVFRDEVGAWIAPGIAQGIDQEAHQAVAAVQSLAGNLVRAWAGGQDQALNLVTSGTLPAGSGLPFTAGLGSGGGGGVNVQVNVAGHVWQTQDLVTAIQQQLLRHNVRNPSNATNYSFG